MHCPWGQELRSLECELLHASEKHPKCKCWCLPGIGRFRTVVITVNMMRANCLRVMTFLHLLQAVFLITHAKIALTVRAHCWLMFSLLSTKIPKFFSAQLLLSNYHYERLPFPGGQPFSPSFLNLQGCSLMWCWAAEFSLHILFKINFKENIFFLTGKDILLNWEFNCFST